MNTYITDLISSLQIPADYQSLAIAVLSLAVIVLLAVIAHFLARLIVLRFVEALLLKTNNKHDDVLVNRHVFRRIVHIIPALVMYSLAEPMLQGYPTLVSFINTVCMLYMVIMIALFVDSLLDAGLEIYRHFEVSRHVPVKSFVQVAKLIVYFLAIIAGISVVLGESPMRLIAGLGAMTAVLMLVFKDPILGFVAGLQLSSNRMVARGDWIEMPKHGVDGDVVEIALTTVKVKNFDNTITTVPTQSLINDSFKNWRGMQLSGGRRIKRSVNIDVSTIRFCTEEMLERFSKIQYISDYIKTKQEELAAFNGEQAADLSMLANGRRLTNIGTFRAYIEAYLRNHEQISKELTFLVRQLKPSDNGVPIEVYVFSREKRWIEYEGIQSDIFDHILAVAGEFDLRVFQNPSTFDFDSLGQQ